MNELEALTILTTMPLLGSIKIRLLLQTFGSALKALEADPEEVAALPGFGQKISSNWYHWKKDCLWQKNLELADRLNVRIISFTSPEYPKKLLEVYDHPILLYVMGTLKKEDANSIAIVGTRQATIYGMEMGDAIAQDLAGMRYTVVSGLARGIDTAVHEGALKRGRTIAVIGSGLADIYPRENISLAHRIATGNGAVISQFPMTSPPDRQNFPQRNSTVSGMTLGTLLIEAPLKSGAMITMERAGEQKRKRFALPGRVDWENFTGNHALIKNQEAQLIENAYDIQNSFESLFLDGQRISRPKEGILLEPEESEFLSRMPRQEISIEELLQATKMPIKKLNILLMSLLLKKAIKEFPGKLYKRV